MAEYINLPDFLITYEEYIKLQDPPLKNLAYMEIMSTQAATSSPEKGRQL